MFIWPSHQSGFDASFLQGMFPCMGMIGRIRHDSAFITTDQEISWNRVIDIGWRRENRADEA